MAVNVNLNIHWNAPEYVWKNVDEVFRSMDYYEEGSEYPRWTCGEHYIEASREASGLQFFSTMPEDMWDKWYSELKLKLTKALGYEIGEPEDGYDFKYDWD
ncbi:MAG: hypothetical protein IKO84_11025 [Butyrivibrio sp.]|nr:hypothetical protein [Butyrivibrio sp.]